MKKYDFSFDVTGIADFVKDHQDDLFKEVILNTPTFDGMTIADDARGASVRVYDLRSDMVYQTRSASGGFSADGKSEASIS